MYKRQQLAQGYLQHFAGTAAAVYSAGVDPKGVNPLAVQVMAEDGIDISHHTSNHVDEYADIAFDYVITVCDNAREQCPVFPSTAQKIHQSFTDPGHQPVSYTHLDVYKRQKHACVGIWSMNYRWHKPPFRNI